MQATFDSRHLNDDLVLVSGVSGFVGSQVALAFLDAGFKVRGTVRSIEKGAAWNKKHAKYSDQIEWVIVEDIAAPGAFDEAVEDVTIVVHTASPFHYDVKDNENDMLKPAIAGTRNMLEACASDKGSKIKRVVITSSFAAVLDLKSGLGEDTSYNHETWNPVTYEEAVKSDDATAVYCASKKLAEEAAWKFVKDNKVNFSLATICPPLIFGPPQQVVTDLKSLNTSSDAVWSIVDAKQIPDTSFPVGTDVRDIAKAHLLAATKSEAAGQRYLTIAHHFNNSQIAKIIKEKFPEQAHRIVDAEVKQDPHFKTDSSHAEKQLGLQWIPFEQTVVDTARELFNLEKTLK
ncbi:hypothetical protein OIV83_002072 [Microbotryomycetes sp. JL201]|nr:hypothetical protein OIV83_002072 [Microbotryomycetes sp. JL201]